jgi:hypothetical protein
MKRQIMIAAISLIMLIIPSIFPVSIQKSDDNILNIVSDNFQIQATRNSTINESYNGPTMYQFDQQRSGRSPFNATGNPGRVKRIIEIVSIDAKWILVDEESNIYCIDYYANLNCYYPNFTLKWSKNFDYNGNIPIYYNHVIYMMNNKHLIAINSNNGSFIYDIHTNSGKNTFCILNHEKSIINIVIDKYNEYNIFQYYLNGTFIEAFKIELPDTNHYIYGGTISAVGSDNSIYFSYYNNTDYSHGICAIYPNETLKWIKSHDRSLGYPFLDEADNIFYVSQYLGSYFPNGTLNWKMKVDNWGIHFAPQESRLICKNISFHTIII